MRSKLANKKWILYAHYFISSCFLNFFVPLHSNLHTAVVFRLLNSHLMVFLVFIKLGTGYSDTNLIGTVQKST
jgi:hypothetical protein